MWTCEFNCTKEGIVSFMFRGGWGVGAFGNFRAILSGGAGEAVQPATKRYNRKICAERRAGLKIVKKQ